MLVTELDKYLLEGSNSSTKHSLREKERKNKNKTFYEQKPL